MIPFGRFDKLGSVITNISRDLPLYAKAANPVFKETLLEPAVLFPFL